ncbi:hypothetical protein Tco_0591788 [Tanacetum coccineum]
MLIISLKLKMMQFYLQNQLLLRNRDVIEKEANIEVEEAFPAKKGKKLKGIATEDPTVQSILDLQKGSKESKLESIRQEIEAGRREGSKKDDDKDDAKVFNMDISDDDSDKGDDDAAGFRVFMYDKTKKPPKFTPISPADTKLNFIKAVEKKFKEYDQKLEALSTINVPEAIEKSVQEKVLTKMKKQLPTHVPKAIANFVKPRLNNIVLEVIKNNQINLFTTPSTTTTDDLLELELKIKLYNMMYQNRSFEIH